MWDLRACLVCLSMDVKLFDLNEGSTRQHYNLLTGLQITRSNGMPEYLCLECTSNLRRFIKFRDKCHRAHYVLQELLQKKKTIKRSVLKYIDRDAIKIKPSLSYLNVENAHYEEIKFKWVKNSRESFLCNDIIPVVTYTTLRKEDTFESSTVNGNVTDLEHAQIKEENDVNIPFEIVLERLCENDDKEFSKETPEYHLNDVKESYDFDNDICNSDVDMGSYVDDADTSYKENIDNDISDVNDTCKEQEADGSKLDEEYATIHPITVTDARAAIEVLKLLGNGKYTCEVCSKTYNSESRLKVHLRMHDKHVSGNFYCELCKYYYKTDFLLKTHMTDKHMYKYVCKKCPEVNFDRLSAKQHFVFAHMQKSNADMNALTPRPLWLSKRGGKRIKGKSTKPKTIIIEYTRTSRKKTSCKSTPDPCVRKRRIKLPKDFLRYTPVSQEEQYRYIQERKNSRNYRQAKFQCQLCYRGYREANTYNKHMRKHDPEVSGQIQCDMCKLHFINTRKLYKHMNITHLFKYSCQLCPFVCFSRGQAHMHYRWHKNVTYQCPHCKKDFKKASTRLTHIRIKHPSTNICNICGHSFVSETGLYCHKKIAHTQLERDSITTTEIDTEDQLYCADCNVQFVDQAAFTTHLGSSNKHASTNISIKSYRVPRGSGLVKRGSRAPRRGAGTSEILNNGVATATSCEICNKFLVNDVQARKHYESEHPGAEFLKRYMCDVCGHTTKQYANLMVHMRTHTNEKPYGCPHCDRRFSMPSNRDRHLVVHTGEKRYQCQHCNRRFTQSSAVKLHIQTVHLKIPYAPWDKKNRKRRKELEGTSAPVSTVNAITAACLQPPPKLLLDTQGDYLNAYITYNDE